MEFPIANVALTRPLVRKKGRIIFWVIDVEDGAVNLTRKYILRVEGIVFYPAKIFLVLRKKRRVPMILKKGIPLLSLFQNSLLFEFNFILGPFFCGNTNSINEI
jgi:hypothetical protein